MEGCDSDGAPDWLSAAVCLSRESLGLCPRAIRAPKKSCMLEVMPPGQGERTPAPKDCMATFCPTFALCWTGNPASEDGTMRP